MTEVNMVEIVPGHKPTLLRLFRVFLRNRDISVLRALQYEIVSNLELTGKIIDFGGGEKASYRKIIKSVAYYSVNIDQKMSPSAIIGVGEEIPYQDSEFHTAISFNTFEHIFDPIFCLKEISRVLKSSGEFVATVPFLFPVHAHPDDFFRPTPSWWGLALKDAGFSDVRVMPLYWGPFTTGMVASGMPGPFKRIRLLLALVMDLVYNKFRHDRESISVNHALGYFVWARKNQA